MESNQVLILFLMLIFTLFSTGVESGDLTAAGQASMTSTVIRLSPPAASTIGCGSILDGFLLPACPSTIDGFTPPPRATTITELPIGGDGFGVTPTYAPAPPTSVANTSATLSTVGPVTLSTITSASVLNPTTLTATLPPVTLTQTVSEVISNSMTTATALCFLGDPSDDILTECTKTVDAPIATASVKSAAIPVTTNPFKFISGTRLFKALFGDRSLSSLLRHINHHNLRRAVSSSCELGITAFVVFGLGVIVFICVIARGYREWRASGDISGWTQVKGYMLLVGISWLLALALVFYRQC